MPAVSVIGIGNTLMGDDGVGVRIAEKLAGQLQGARVVTGHMAGMSLMPAVMSAEVVIFVDAVAVGEEAGAIYRFDPDEAGITGLRSTTSHGMGIPYLPISLPQLYRPTLAYLKTAGIKVGWFQSLLLRVSPWLIQFVFEAILVVILLAVTVWLIKPVKRSPLAALKSLAGRLPLRRRKREVAA
jgi:hydrogenase maturation protease